MLQENKSKLLEDYECDPLNYKEMQKYSVLYTIICLWFEI